MWIDIICIVLWRLGKTVLNSKLNISTSVDMSPSDSVSVNIV